MKIVFEYRFFHGCQEFVQCPFKSYYLIVVRESCRCKIFAKVKFFNFKINEVRPTEQG